MLQEDSPLIIVGVGASAGGLEALELMFDGITSDSRMAFVVVQHLSPDFRSLMDELLARHTKLPIYRVEDGMEVQPGSVYLIPPKKEMIISNGRLLLSDKDNTAQWTLPIDIFFKSLAQDAKQHSVGVVLSGTGSDGSSGIVKIHEAGGLVIIQSEESAKFNGMPRSAIDTGMADLVVPPEKIGPLLSRYAENPTREAFLAELTTDSDSEPVLQTVFSALQREYGLDFRQYKPGTMLRRLHRRSMMANCSSVEEYANTIVNDAAERRALYGDLLIGVTKFFRDHETFESLQIHIRQQLSSEWNDDMIRAWVCGCSTGQEAYTVAMILHDEIQKLGRTVGVRVFATDIDRSSLEFAGQGQYDAADMRDMPPEFVQRYFTESPHGFQVIPELRSTVTFAQHNALRDAPFTNLHLITCRNFLIYLNTDAQQKVLSLLCFGLRGKGILVLGSSESPGEIASELTVLNAAEKIFMKHGSARSITQRISSIDLSGLSIPAVQARQTIRTPAPGMISAELLSVYDSLLGNLMPAAILVNQEGLVIQVFGEGAKFLSIPTGRVSSRLIDLVLPELRLAITGAMHRVHKTLEPIATGRLSATVDGIEWDVNLTVSPIHAKTGRVYQMIRFERAVTEIPSPVKLMTSSDVALPESAAERIDELSLELNITRENLQATIEELETSNEELQATNEEMIASNEELQSTNEELHSVNEELYTVNAEHQKKIAELTKLNNDFDNLLASTDVHTVFLDDDLNIRLFTPRAVEVFNFSREDVGRRFDSFTHRLKTASLTEDLLNVLQTGVVIEREVTDGRQRSFLMRILPYLVVGKPCGVVITMLDISARADWEAKLRESNERFERAIKATRDGIWDWPDVKSEHQWWSPMCYEILGYEPNAFPSTYSHWLMHIHPDDRDKIRQISTPHPHNSCYVEMHRDFEYRMMHKDGKYRWFQHRALIVHDNDGKVLRMTGSVVDIDVRKQLEESLRDQVKHRDDFLAVLSHELRNPLGAVTNAISLAGETSISEAQKEECLRVIREQSRHMNRLLDDLLDVSRVQHNKMEMRMSAFDLAGTAAEVLSAVQMRANTNGISISFVNTSGPVHVLADRDRIIQCQVNLIGNAIKFTPQGGAVDYEIGIQDGMAEMSFRDNGVGMSKALNERIFELFSQGKNEPRNGDSGIGVGLALVRSIAELHSGTVSAYSDGLGKGSYFKLRIPLAEKPLDPTQLTGADGQNGASLQPSADGKRVLIVDDLPDGRSMLAQLLSIRGYQVVEAEDGKSGLEAADQQAFDVALIDLGLPDMSGLDVARTYQEKFPSRGTKLIAITGYGQRKDLGDTALAGFHHHLTKPLDIKRLFKIIQEEGTT